jgi:hypothetical protein
MKVAQCLRTIIAAGSLTLGAATANADIIKFGTALGPEVTGATGGGAVVVDYDEVEHTLRIVADWTGLSGTTTVAHIHCCVVPPGTAGVAVTPGTLPGFPVVVTGGSYVSPLIDLDLAASFTTTFLNGLGGGTVEGARNALLAGMTDGTAYFNIHTNAFPAGEIRGFLHRVPEPAMLSLLVLGLVPLAGAGLRKR